MGFDPRPCFRWSPKENTYRKVDERGETVQVTRSVDCVVEKRESLVTLSFHVMEVDNLDTRNDLIHSKHYSLDPSFNSGNFPREFQSKHPYLYQSLRIAAGRCDQDVAEILWRLFIDLEVDVYVDNCVELIQGRASLIKEYFPNEWDFWKRINLQSKSHTVSSVMDS